MKALKNLARTGAALLGVMTLQGSGCNKTTDNTVVPPIPPAPCKNTGDICTIAGTGTEGFAGDGQQAWAADLSYPMDMAIGPDKLLYIVDWNNHRLRRVAADGTISTIAGSGELGDTAGLELASSFNHPTSIAFDAQGRVIIAAWHNSRLKRLDPTTGKVENICGSGKRWYSGDDGPAMTADLDLPTSIALDADGNTFLMDQANQLIRMVDSDGKITRVAGQCIIGSPDPMNPDDAPVACPQGTGIQTNSKMAYGLAANPGLCKDYHPCAAAFAGDDGLAINARLGQPVGQAATPGGRLVLDKAGNLIFADTKNNRLRKIDKTTKIITTIAGNGMRGYAATDEGLAATAVPLAAPVDIDTAADGTIYFADTGNHCIRKIGTDGKISTVAGQCGKPGYAGDGAAATTALFDTPFGIALDQDGNLLIADTQNNLIRKVLLK